MKNLLVGNGANIQFDPINYTTKQIVLRVLKGLQRDDYPEHVIVRPKYLLRNYLGLLFLEIPDIVEGKYDTYAYCTAERISLKAFKEQYTDTKKRIRITDIGFEDYYLIHDLLCHKYGIFNPEQYYIREAMKLAYIFSVYNDGKLNKLYKLYSDGYINYLLEFDNIFTTNYDSNIELASGKNVYHIHGQFDVLDEVYNEKSFRNQLPDPPIKYTVIDEKFIFLYSNVISTHCGDYKEYFVKQNTLANEAVQKFAESYSSNIQQQKEINSWQNSNNALLVNLSSAIQIKAKRPDLKFTEYYHFEDFKKMTGTLEILGLSPWNDYHIFESIDKCNLDLCIYYFFEDNDRKKIIELLPQQSNNNRLIVKSVKEFWKEKNEKQS